MMVDYIDQHRGEFGVESICNELPIAPSTYHDFKQRQPSARAQRDAVMLPIVMALFVANYRVYGARKLWIAAQRAGHNIGRDQVTRLMTILDIHGATRRRKRVWTTRSDGSPCSPDLVERNFTAAAPNELWVTDIKCRRRHLISYADLGTMPILALMCCGSRGSGVDWSA